MNRSAMAALLAAAFSADMGGRSRAPARRGSPRKPRKRGPINRTQEQERRKRQIESGILWATRRAP